MNSFVILVTVMPCLLLCLIRKKAYSLSTLKAMLILLFFSVSGIVGALLGQYLVYGVWGGQRLYGLMMMDTIMLLIMSPLLKMNIGDLGDFISVPIMLTCGLAKIECVRSDCCYGFVLYQHEMCQPVRFPSQIIELIIWIILTLVLLLIERKGRMKNMLWPFSLIWFGVFRFVVDFFRGSEIELEAYALQMSGGKFWSLVVLVVGVVFMYFTLRHELGRAPKLNEVAKASIGKM